MGYELQAVIADAELLRIVSGDLARQARPVPLRQGLALLPLTGELYDAVAAALAEPPPGFHLLPPGFDRALAAWSVLGPLAYVEADYFGGTGEQAAAVWEAGRPALGPLRVEIGEPFPDEGSPISQALRRLGVRRGHARDEFEAAGLGARRHTEDWATG